MVRESYRDPAGTYAANVMGTVNLLEAARGCGTVRAIVNFTSDKCYENREWAWGYRDNESLGGHDPYSSSKACAELVTSAYRRSFFGPDTHGDHGVGLASVRAGNIIGGGDWGADRLVPDCIRAFLGKEEVVVRNPGAIRPWQHVLEPLTGCLMVAESLCRSGPAYSSGWNFGPGTDDARSVESLVRALCERWGGAKGYRIDDSSHPHEAHYLKLDCSKAVSLLGWRQRWSLDTAIDKVLDWTRGYVESRDVREICLQQIAEYTTGEKGRAERSRG
jgi:CDP-glucose 4,6-dehydratase